MPPTLWTIAHLVLGVSCLTIAATFFVLLHQTPTADHPYARTARLLIAVFAASGVLHLIALTSTSSVMPGVEWLSILTAVAAALLTASLISDLVTARGAMSFSELEQQIKKSSAELLAAHNERVELADKIAARTLELSEAMQRFETTLRRAPIFVSNQDRHLKYTWVRNPPPGYAAEDMLGRDDAHVFPAEIASQLITLKANTISTKEHGRLELKIEAGDEIRWYEVAVDPVVNHAGDITGITTAAVDVTHRRSYEAHLKLLLRDVTHRAKNVLAVVTAVARQTATRTTTKEEFVDRFSARVQSLARAHDLLVNQDWQGVRMLELVHSQLSRYEKLLDTRIFCEGPDVTLGPEATQNLGLAIHELVHNAGKYGALSNDIGIVRVTWAVKGTGGERRFQFSWDESEGPPVVAEERMGFGRTFIERAVGRTLDGSAKLEFRPSGVHCELDIPGYHLLRLGSD